MKWPNDNHGLGASVTDDERDELMERMAADAEALDTSPAEEPKGKGPRKKIKIIIVMIVVILVAAIGGIVAFKFLANNSSENPDQPNGSGQVSSIPGFKKDPAMDNMVTLPPFELSLKDDMGSWEFRVTITIEAANSSVKNEIEEKLDTIYDTIVPQLLKRSPTALQGVDTKIALKTELIAIVNKIVTKGKIKNLYFTRFYVL